MTVAEKIAFDIYCGAHAGSNQVELEVSCLEECSQGTSPTIDHLIRLGVLRLATPDGTLEVKWLRKAKLSKSAFTPGDYVQTSTGHVALLMDLFQVNGTIIFQLCLLAQGPHSRDDLKLTWALLEAATCAPLDQCSFASMEELSLQLLHPTSTEKEPSVVRFMSW